MKIVESPLIEGDEFEQAWQLYSNAFATMNDDAAQRHLMNDVELGEICADARINKIRVFDDDGELVGLTAVTTVLNAVPLIEPRFFAKRWPERYQDAAIWYIEFMAAKRNGLHAYREMVMTMYRQVKQANGIAAMDFCTYNDLKRHLPQITDTLLSRADPMTRGGKVDAQGYWVWAFDGKPVLEGAEPVDNRHLDGGEVDFSVELVLDYSGCDLEVISSKEKLARFSEELVEKIGMEAYGAPQLDHFGEGDITGYTLVQKITTSLVSGIFFISAHLGERTGKARFNIHTCGDLDADAATEFVSDFLKAGAPKKRTLLVR
jgi:S-adenosylmethionine/arginine decarboxylase-like enzyme